MEELPKQEMYRLHNLLLQDDEKRNRGQFTYAFDILGENWAAPYSIWPMPNNDVFRVISGGVNLKELPYEDLNEAEKGMFFEDLRNFIAQHIKNGRMLCEARNYESCLEEKCPVFRVKNTEVGGEHGICSEFKTAFKK